MMTQKQKYGYRFMYLIACQAVKYFQKNPKRASNKLNKTKISCKTTYKK